MTRVRLCVRCTLRVDAVLIELGTSLAKLGGIVIRPGECPSAEHRAGHPSWRRICDGCWHRIECEVKGKPVHLVGAPTAQA